MTAPHMIGRVFTTMGPNFMIYTKYYTNHPRAMTRLQVLLF